MYLTFSRGHFSPPPTGILVDVLLFPLLLLLLLLLTLWPSWSPLQMARRQCSSSHRPVRWPARPLGFAVPLEVIFLHKASVFLKGASPDTFLSCLLWKISCNDLSNKPELSRLVEELKITAICWNNWNKKQVDAQRDVGLFRNPPTESQRFRSKECRFFHRYFTPSTPVGANDAKGYSNLHWKTETGHNT